MEASHTTSEGSAPEQRTGVLDLSPSTHQCEMSSIDFAFRNDAPAELNRLLTMYERAAAPDTPLLEAMTALLSVSRGIVYISGPGSREWELVGAAQRVTRYCSDFPELLLTQWLHLLARHGAQQELGWSSDDWRALHHYLEDLALVLQSQRLTTRSELAEFRATAERRVQRLIKAADAPPPPPPAPAPAGEDDVAVAVAVRKPDPKQMAAAAAAALGKSATMQPKGSSKGKAKRSGSLGSSKAAGAVGGPGKDGGCVVM